MVVLGLVALPVLSACGSASQDAGGLSPTISPTTSPKSPTSPTAAPGALFGAVGPDPGTGSGSATGVLRSRTTTLTLDALIDGSGAERTGPFSVRLNLFADVQPVVTLTLARDPSITSWSGSLPSGMPGEARIVRVADAFMVSLTTGRVRYEASRLPGGTYRIIEIDPAGGAPD